MKLNKNLQIVEIADEWLAIPIGDEAAKFNGVVTLNEASAFLLSHMEEDRTIPELVVILRSEYDVTPEKAEEDITALTGKLLNMGLLEE